MDVSQGKPLAQQIFISDEKAPKVFIREKWRGKGGELAATRQRQLAPQRIDVVMSRSPLDLGFAKQKAQVLDGAEKRIY